MDSSKKIWLVFLALVIVILGGVKLGMTYFVKDYDSHLSAAVYKKTVIDQNVNLVFYKPGCPYCKAGKLAVIKAAEDNPFPTFYIDMTSKDGSRLVKQYGVTKPATIIKIRGGNYRFYTYATKTKSGRRVADEKAIRRAFNERKGQAGN